MPDRRYTPAVDAPLEEYLRVMPAHGFSHAVLIQPSILGFDNSYLLRALRAHPRRLRGIVALAPDTPRPEMEALALQGVAGVRFNLFGRDDPDFASPAWRYHLGNLADLGWLLEVHGEAGRLKPILAAAAERHITLVIDHYGRPDPALGIDDPGFRHLLEAARRSNVFVKLSASYRLGQEGHGRRIAEQAFPLLLQSFGVHRLLWGSDWPHVEFEMQAAKCSNLFNNADQLLNASQQKAIFEDNPAALFNFNRTLEGAEKSPDNPGDGNRRTARSDMP